MDSLQQRAKLRNKRPPGAQSIQDEVQPELKVRKNVNSQPVSASFLSIITVDIYELLTIAYTLFPEILSLFVGMVWRFSSGARFQPTTQIPSLAGKVIFVTGGNNGIGYETCLQLAKHQPAKIYMGARSASKAEAAIEKLKSETNEKVNIEHISLDLMSLASVKAAAEQLSTKSDRLDILVLNAGIMATPPGRTQEGFDDQMGTNHFGHFYLTKLLLPTLTKTAAEPDSDVRVVSLSSEAWKFAPKIETITSTDKLVQTGPWTRYGASKASNIMFATEFAQRYPQITTVSIHPGIINTDLLSNNMYSFPLFGTMVGFLKRFIFTDVSTGTFNTLWASARAKKEDLTNGAFYTPVGALSPNKWTKDAQAAGRLWRWTEEEIEKAGF